MAKLLFLFVIFVALLVHASCKSSLLLLNDVELLHMGLYAYSPSCAFTSVVILKCFAISQRIAKKI